MENTETAFLIMQIGNADMDSIYKNNIDPAIRKSGLDPKRIDKHNKGNLLKSEIIDNIQKARIIVADLTNERPNCYLEIGYAMGLDKFSSLILTAREDHHHDSPKYVKGGPKIHFDLAGYDILFWSPDNLLEFEKELTNRINRRLLLTTSSEVEIKKDIWDNEWVESQRKVVNDKIEEIGIRAYLEIMSTPLKAPLNLNQSQIMEITKKSLIPTFGWAIGLIGHDLIRYRPIPKTDGVLSEIALTEKVDKSYDYSYYRKNGQNFIVNTFFEDYMNLNSAIVVTRVYRITEAFMYLAKYYKNAGFDVSEPLEIRFKHTGISGRYVAHDARIEPRMKHIAVEDQIQDTLVISITEIESRLPELVYQIVHPLFQLFDFYELRPEQVAEHVNKFVDDTRRGVSS